MSSPELLETAILTPEKTKEKRGGGEAYCEPTEVLSSHREGEGTAWRSV